MVDLRKERPALATNPAAASQGIRKLGYSVPESCRLGVVDLAEMIRERRAFAIEVMTAYVDHIDAVNPLVRRRFRQRHAALPATKLVATFDHRDIFIDPSPDPSISTPGLEPWAR